MEGDRHGVEVEVEDNETALEEEAVSPESNEAATEEIKEADVEEETIEEPVMEVTEERTAHEEDKELDEIIEPEQVEVVQEAKLAAEVRVAQAIWTEDNTTLTFYYGLLVSCGDTFNGASVTEVWSGTDVTDSCDGDPAWRNTVSEFLTNVVFDVSFLTVSPRSMHNWFRSCKKLTSVDMSGLNTSNVTNMSGMFYLCKSLKSLDVSGFDTSRVTDMRSMFNGCWNLTSLDVSGFDTSNVEDMSYMFDGCSSLTDIDVSRFDTSNVEDMKYMFSSCGITSIDLSGFDTASVDDTESMFYSCTNLKTTGESN